MPCNSDHLSPTSRELEMSRVACLIDELDGKTWTSRDWNGQHPRVYNCRRTKQGDDAQIRALCTSLKSVDVTKYSLEMQIWWRDHQIEDSKREQREAVEAHRIARVALALKKLTPDERAILGFQP